jgi:hypothetical protein
MPVTVQRDAALIALGFDPATVEWHHSPPLGLRPYDEATGKYTPDANDPRYIVPMGKAPHRERTAKIDVPAIAKTKQLTKNHAAFVATMLAKAGVDDAPRDVRRSRIPTRPFQKGHRPMRSQRASETTNTRRPQWT